MGGNGRGGGGIIKELIRFIHDRMPVIFDPFSAEPEFFANDPEDGSFQSSAESGKRSGHTRRPEEVAGIKNTFFDTGNVFAQGESITTACGSMENTGRSIVNDWINPGTGAWRLQEIVGKGVTDLVYERC